VKQDGLLEQVEAARVDGDDRRDDSSEHFSRAKSVIEVSAVILPARVVKQGEKANNGQIGTTACGDVDPKSIDPLPVAWPVDGMSTALENGHHVFTNSSKPSLWRAFHIRNPSDSLSHLAFSCRR
jgi:hypothetical protein